MRQLLVAVGLLGVVGLLAGFTVTRVAGSPDSYAGAMADEGATSLDFAQSGRVAKIYVRPGDRVTAGQLVANQDQNLAQTALTDARAVLAANRARLAALQNPQVSSADQKKVALQVGQAQDQLAKSQTAARDATTAAASDVAQAQQTVAQGAALVRQDAARFAAACPQGVVVPPVQAVPTVVPGAAAAQNAAFATYQNCLNLQTQEQKDTAAAAEAAAGLQHTQATGQQLQDTAQAQVGSAQAALQLAQNEGAVQSAPASAADTSSAEADVAAALAQVDQDQQALSQLTLISPISGTVGSVGGILGDLDGPTGVHVYAGPYGASSASSSSFSLFPSAPSANSSSNAATDQQPLVTVEGNAYTAVAQVSETEIPKLHNGSAARVTINALNRTLPGTVVGIVPIPVRGSGSVQYDVRVSALSWPSQVMPGMSVSVTFS